MVSYQEQLEKRIEELENLWFKDTDGLEAIKEALEKVKDSSEDIQDLLLNLQNPASPTNKHGDAVYSLIKEKIIYKFDNLRRSINAVSIVIDKIRNLDTHDL